MYLQLIKQLEEVKENQIIHSKMLNTIMIQLKQNPAITLPVVPEGAVFPLKTVQEVEAMNAKLGDSDFKAAVVCFLIHSTMFLYLPNLIHFKMYVSNHVGSALTQRTRH